MVLAHLVVGTGAAEHAAHLRQVLEPFGGMIATGNGVGVSVPIDLLLAQLALLDDDAGAAVTAAESSVAISRAMPAPALEARSLATLAAARAAAGDIHGADADHRAARELADPIGLVVPDPASPGTGLPILLPISPPDPRVRPDGSLATSPRRGRTAALRRTADGWAIDCPYGRGQVAASRGMDQLVRLLSSAAEVPAVELAGMATEGGGAVGAVVPAADLGPVLDARAKREYRARVTELQEEIDEAEADADIERASRARTELDLLLDELRRAVGIGGRDRPTSSGAERARVNVARSLRRAVSAVDAVIPGLGSHLRVSVRTGRYCAYDPEPATALTWTVDGA
jgi:hypothetical protein